MNIFNTNTPYVVSPAETAKVYSPDGGSPYIKVRIYAPIGGLLRVNVWADTPRNFKKR